MPLAPWRRSKAGLAHGDAEPARRKAEPAGSRAALDLGNAVIDAPVRLAEHEQIAEGTVKSRLHYALKALRNALQERGVVR